MLLYINYLFLSLLSCQSVFKQFSSTNADFCLCPGRKSIAYLYCKRKARSKDKSSTPEAPEKDRGSANGKREKVVPKNYWEAIPKTTNSKVSTDYMKLIGTEPTSSIDLPPVAARESKACNSQIPNPELPKNRNSQGCSISAATTFETLNRTI